MRRSSAWLATAYVGDLFEVVPALTEAFRRPSSEVAELAPAADANAASKACTASICRRSALTNLKPCAIMSSLSV